MQVTRDPEKSDGAPLALCIPLGTPQGSIRPLIQSDIIIQSYLFGQARVSISEQEGLQSADARALRRLARHCSAGHERLQFAVPDCILSGRSLLLAMQAAAARLGVEIIKQYPAREQVELKVKVQIPGSWFGGLTTAERAVTK